MKYHFTQQVINNILIVFKKSFSSREEAEQWNEKTDICQNFDLMTGKEISDWEGEVIRIPIDKKRRRKK